MSAFDMQVLALDPAYARDNWVHSTMYTGRGVLQKRTWDAAVKWVITTQLDWESLTDSVALNELRKGERSVFYPLFEADPHIRADCVGCGRDHVFDVEGICSETGWEIQ